MRAIINHTDTPYLETATPPGVDFQHLHTSVSLNTPNHPYASFVFDELGYAVFIVGRMWTHNDTDLDIHSLAPRMKRTRALELSQFLLKGDLTQFSRCDGAFVFMLYSKASAQLYILNDRYGTMPLFISRTTAATIVSTSPRSAAPSAQSAKLSAEVALQLFSCRYVVTNATLYRTVTSLPPASHLIIDKTRYSESIYWLPGADRIDPSPIRSRRPRPIARENELAERLEEAVGQCASSQPHILVPLSGGLDSRAILAILLQSRQAHDIHTLTFGSKGTFDFDIGNLVAKAAGTNHTSIELSTRQLTAEDILNRAARMHGLVDPFENAPWEDLTHSLASPCRLLSGFLGDPLTGSHLHPWTFANHGTLTSAEMFIHKQMTLVKSECEDTLTFDTAKYVRQLVEWTSEAHLGTSDPAARMLRWDFTLRQARYIAPSVLPHLDSVHSTSPFTRSVFTDFVHHLTADDLKGQRLYKNTLVRRYPGLFRLPTKTCLGKPLPQRSINRVFRQLATNIASLVPNALRNRLRGRHGSRLPNYYSLSGVLSTSQHYRRVIRTFTDAAENTGLVNRAAITSAWRSFDNGNRDYSRILFGVARIGVASEYLKHTSYIEPCELTL